MKRALAILSLFALTTTLHAAAPKPDGNTLVTPTLHADTTAIKPGQTFQVAVNFKIEKGWHVYWLNPGDAGQPPSVKWTVPDGVTVGEAQFPTPFDLTKGDIKTYGYEDEMTLLFDVKVADDFKGDSAELKADVKWLVCEKICLPGKATLSLKVGAGAKTEGSAAAAQFKAWRVQLPLERSDFGNERAEKTAKAGIVGASIFPARNGKSAYLCVIATKKTFQDQKVIWFPPPSDRLVFDQVGEPTTQEKFPNLYTLVGKVRVLGIEPLGRQKLTGLLVTVDASGKRQGYIVSIDVPAIQAGDQSIK